MPPFGFRKRQHSPSPQPSPSKNNHTPRARKTKTTVFDSVDAPSREQRTLEDNKKVLQSLVDSDEDDESSLSEVDSDEFEDVPVAKKRKLSPSADTSGDEDDEDEDEMDWEDAIQGSSTRKQAVAAPEPEIADVSIAVKEDGSYLEPVVSAGIVKKGPSKRERQIRTQSHCLHVQALMWHNTIRNSWLNDPQVHQILLDGLTDGVKREVQRWREAMGMLSAEELQAKKKQAMAKNKGRHGKKRKGAGRDWNPEAEHREQGVPNLSGGDPLLRLLKVLTAYWRKRFTITAPGLRKQGFKPLRRLRDEIQGWQKNKDDVEEYGERIKGVEDLRRWARTCEGSRDVGAQLFVALLRALRLETRLVANLQPVGFGWSKTEEADPKKPKKKEEKALKTEVEAEEKVPPEQELRPMPPKRMKVKSTAKANQTRRASSRGNKTDPIPLDDSDSPLSSSPSDLDDDDDLSVVDVTPAPIRQKPNKKYDRDLSFPHYWAEVCSPVTHKYYPVDPIVLSTIASTDELLQTFEPRGKRVERAKQVICYTLAFASDGSAKDVTVRYLKRHQLPGKTKGFRMPVEKVPIYNRKGKVRHYEIYDWIRTILSLYDRPESKRTPADDLEDATDLRPFTPAKPAKDIDKESLQWYKQSAEFVLSSHLRREEALRPGAQPVKTFTAGKGDKAKTHDVYLRADLLLCKTVESWHKEGRAIKLGEQPVKYVPMRAVTLLRKREIEDAQRETGEKLQQGLYARGQTDWIIPAPIHNGVIPKNAFGNMDVYVPTMVPQGAVHLRLKGSAKICRKLEIDYAEACTGFEFGKQRAVPVLTGVVVAKENEQRVKVAWREMQEEVRRKEDVKRTALSLHWWRKMLLGLRVLERMRVEYRGAEGGGGDDVNPFVLKARREGRAVVDLETEEMGQLEGGFLPEGHEDEEEGMNETVGSDVGGGGFFIEDGEEDVPSPHAGGFLIEDGVDGEEDEADPTVTSKPHAPITPVSLQSMHKTADEDENTSEGSSVAAAKSAETKGKTKANGRPASGTRKRQTKQSNSSKRTSIASSRRASKRPSTPTSSEEEDGHGHSSSALSDLASSSNAISASASDSEQPASRTKISPKVAVPSTHYQAEQNVKKQKTSRARRTGRKAKETPVKSPYFSHESDFDTVNEDEGLGDDDDDEESEEEVVRPRMTTARTRTRTRGMK